MPTGQDGKRKTNKTAREMQKDLQKKKKKK